MLPFVAEDGTGIATATSYLSLAAWAANVTTAITGTTVEQQAALIRASAWVDATFGRRFPGARAHGRSQGLAWPRSGATDADGEAIAVNVIPVEILRATAEAALRDLASPGALAPDIVPLSTSGGTVKKQRKWMDGIGGSETEYTEGSASGPSQPVFPVIDGILAPLLGSSGGGMIALLRA